LPNTENTILENWPGPKTTDPPRRPNYHFALRQDNVNLDFHLEQFYRSNKISLHYFESFEQLVTICQRFSIDTIVIGGKSDFLREIELVQAIKQNVFLSIIPIILYHPAPEVNVIVAAYENGAEDFIYGEWKDKLVKVRIKRVIERSQRDLAVNPSTCLPGPAIIEREITRQLDMKAEFAVCYADLDNFKAYNDYYGYVEGDKVIRLTAAVIKDIVFDLCREGFVGHIAGDDFIMIVPTELVEPVCRWTIRTFDALIPCRYESADRERGHITTLNRRGEIENFPILTISIAVTINSNGKFSHVGEMSRMLADLKEAIKRRKGSNYMVERRKKY
jgi:diguanylate cyclase (GGDEF)-like protein